jgi:hypothetical protein
MLDAEPVIREELDRLAPYEPAPATWEELVSRAREHGQPPHRRWRSTFVAVVVLLAVGVPTVAFSAGVRGLLGFPISHPVLHEARLLVSGSVGNRFYAHSWVSPSSTGGRCAFTTVDHDPMTRRPQRQGGGGCTIHGNARFNQASEQLPLIVGMSIARRLRSGDPAKWVPPIVSGSVLSRLHTRRVEIRWRGGSHPLTLRGSYFIGGGRFLYMPPFREFPFFVVAYDAGGREVARQKLDSPTLRLMSHGWKQYAQEYRAWQRRLRR